MNKLPEELEAMAFLIGQSNQIDAMMVEKPSTLITSTQTLKKGLSDYVQQQRAQVIQEAAQPAPVPIPNYVPPIDLPQVPQYGNSMFPKTPEPKADDGQLELNLEPSKIEEIIILMKEISTKLTKQNNMIEKLFHQKDGDKKSTQQSK